MEYLETPTNPYGSIRVPYLGELYDPGIADFDTYPKKKGWDLENEGAALEKYRHLGQTYRDVDTLHVVKFLDDLVDVPVGMNEEEQEILRYSLSTLRDLMTAIVQESGSAGSLCLNAGAIALDQAILRARDPHFTRQDLVDSLRKRRLLDLLAIFTNDTFSEDKTAFADRRRRDVSLLVDCDKYQWHPWMLADEDDRTLTEVRKAFCHAQSWLFFGYLHEVFRIFGASLKQSDFLDLSQKFVSTQMLNFHLDRMQVGRYDSARTTALERLHNLDNRLNLALNMYFGRVENRQTANTFSNAWFNQPLSLSFEIKFSIVAAAQ